MKVGEDVRLDGVVTTKGAIGLGAADITGMLSCGGATLAGRDKDGNALAAARMKVGEDVRLDKGFTADGAIHLESADITGKLSCRGAELTGRNEDHCALSAAGMKVGEDVRLDEVLTTKGAIGLGAADITGMLSCGGAMLAGRDEDGNALSAAGMKVGGDVSLGDCLIASGAISLVLARLSGSLHLTPERLAGDQKDADQRKEVSLDASRAQVTGTLDWAPAEQVRGQVNLEGATVGELKDDWSGNRRDTGYWPDDGRLRLDGFTYDRLAGQPQASVDQRLDWICGQYQTSAKGSAAGFATQPYEHLAALYRRAGQDTEARKVAIARRRDLRKYGDLSRYRKFGNWFLDNTIRYGYQAWRAAVLLVIAFAAFWIISVLAQNRHVIVPVGDLVGVHPVPVATHCTSSYPCFYPFGYAIDVVVPIVNVHQADNWGMDGHAPWGWAWVAVTWLMTGLGWALVTLLVAGYTGLVRQQ
jgi:hypothetical protein